MSDWLWTKHALERLHERYQDPESVKNAINKARPCNAKKRKKIRNKTKGAWRRYMTIGRGTYKITSRYIIYNQKHNAVYIVANKHIVVTVFKMED